MKLKGPPLTSLGLIRALVAKPPRPPALPKPEVSVEGLVLPGINPSKMRVGKSGELTNRGGR